MTIFSTHFETQSQRISHLAQRVEAARRRLPADMSAQWAGPAQGLFAAGVHRLSSELVAAQDCLTAAGAALRRASAGPHA